jgi:TP901 family phage tail tape measure protein
MAIGSLGSVSYDIVANDMTGTASQSSQRNMMAVGAAFTGVGLASVAMTRDIKESFLSFDTAMTEVKALGGLTVEEFNAMKQASLDLSTQFPITATDIADAMYLMVSVGYDYQTMMSTMPEAAALATAGSMSMEEATNSLINVMGVYGAETYTASEITKVFANAVGVGKYEMTDFMTEMMKNIGVASQMGIEFSDLAAYNVALQNSFTSAEEAGTSLNRMLIQLSDPSTVKTLNEMGIAVTDNEGRFRDLDEIMGELGTKLAGVTDDAERMAIVQDLFGTYGSRAALAIMSQSEALPELKNQMSELNLIQDQTNTKLEGMSQRLEIANNKMETAKIKLGEGMAPAMILTADAASTLADVLESLPGPLQTVGGMAIYAGQALAAVGPALMGLAAMKALGLGGILTSISGALSGLASSASGVAASAGTAIGGSVIAGVGIGIAAGLAGVWVLLKTGIMQGISDLGRSIESSPVGGVIMDALKVLLAPIGSLGAGIIAVVQGDFENLGDVMAEPFRQAGGVVAGNVTALRNAVTGMVQSFAGMGSIAGYASRAFSGIGSAFSGMAGQVRGVFSQMFNAILGLINSTRAGFVNAGKNIITSIVNGIVAAAGGIVNAIKGALDKVRALFPFSPAKEGPLSETPNWGTWMSSGMEKAGPEVSASAAANLAAPAAAGVAGGAGGAGSAAGGGGSTVNIAPGAIVINGAGQNAEEIANTVIKHLSQQMASTRRARGLTSS